MSTKARKKHTKKQKRLAIIALVAVVVALAIFLCIVIPYYVNVKKHSYDRKYTYDGVSLVGVWQEKENFNHGDYKIYEFLADGRVITTMYTYGMARVQDTESTYRVDDKNTLVITYTVGSTLQNTENKFSISKDRDALVLKDGRAFTVLEKYKLEYNKDALIFGEWVNTQNPSEIYSFKQDYTGSMVDESGKNRIVFSTNGDNLYYFIDEYIALEGYTLSSEFVIDCKYRIENDTLTIEVGDKTSTFIRK